MTWDLKIQTAPASEPITTAEAKSHLKVETADDDTYIDGLTAAAREHVEEVSGYRFITQTWDYLLSAFPAAPRIDLPLLPLVSISTIDYTDQDDNTSTFPIASYVVVAGSHKRKGYVTLKDDQSWPADALQVGLPVLVRFVCGFGAAAAVPERWKHAIKFLLAHWYARRLPVDMSRRSRMVETPLAFSALIHGHRHLEFA